MKRILALLLALIMVLSLAACNKDDTASDVDTSSNITITESDSEDITESDNTESTDDTEQTESTVTDSSSETSTPSSNSSKPTESSKPTTSTTTPSTSKKCDHSNKNYSYTFVSGSNYGTHTITCKDCNNVVKTGEEHTYEYKTRGNSEHKVLCKYCGDLGTESHSKTDDKCSKCGHRDVDVKYVTHPLQTASGCDFAGTAYINDDGTVCFDLMVSTVVKLLETESSLFQYSQDGITFEIPESVMLEYIRKFYSISDAQFEKLKAQGTYNCITTHTYSNGVFHLRAINAGGGTAEYNHKFLGYTSNPSDNLIEVYYDYQTTSGQHQFYYKVTYTVKYGIGLKNIDGNIVFYGMSPLEPLQVISISKTNDAENIPLIQPIN